MSKITKLSLFLITLLTMSAALANGRAPAVEDFVGVEPEGYQRTPQGTEVLFEFGNTVKSVNTQSTTSWTNVTPFAVLVSFLLLPFVMWAAITRSANNVARSMQKDTNVTVLSDFKKEKEESVNSEDQEFDKVG